MKRNLSDWKRIHDQWYDRVWKELIPKTNWGEESNHQLERWPQLMKQFGNRNVLEIGCGSGYLLAWLRSYGYQVNGCDWTEASGRFCELLGIPWQRFDMDDPLVYDLDTIGKTIITSGSVEQLGSNWKPFMEFLKKSQAHVIIHKEPIIELCGSACRRSIQNHRRHNFQEGFITAIPKILHAEHCKIGKRYHAYSEVVWKP